jgi:predicted metal-dependent hydrolase
MPQIELGDIVIDVEKKDVKNVHLSVYPPMGAVRIAAPERMDIDTIRVFAISKLKWIKKQQEEFRNQERESKREYITKETHYFFGKRYLLKVFEHESAPRIDRKFKEIHMYIRANTSIEKRTEVMEEWYRYELKQKLPELIEKWEKIIGVKAYEYGIRKMRTKWGSCNIEAKRIWLNLELAKKPIECTEYIIVHELVHLIERKHNDRFKSLLKKFMPKWKYHRDELNRLPFSHLDWKY